MSGFVDLGALFGAANPALAGFAGSLGTAEPALGSMLGAANPGMAWAGSLGNEAFNTAQPFTNTGGGGVDWGGLAKGLQGAAGAAKGVGDVNQSKALAPPGMGGGGRSQAQRGRGPDLNQLVQLLLQRQQALYPGGGSSGQPQPARATQGLLGF